MQALHMSSHLHICKKHIRSEPCDENTCDHLVLHISSTSLILLDLIKPKLYKPIYMFHVSTLHFFRHIQSLFRTTFNSPTLLSSAAPRCAMFRPRNRFTILQRTWTSSEGIAPWTAWCATPRQLGIGSGGVGSWSPGLEGPYIRPVGIS